MYAYMYVFKLYHGQVRFVLEAKGRFVLEAKGSFVTV